MAITISRRKLSQLLLAENRVTQDQLDAALKQQKEVGGSLGDILVDRDFIDESLLLQIIAKHLNLAFIDIEHYRIDTDIVGVLPEDIARKHSALVIAKEHDKYLVAIVDPLDLEANDAINNTLNLETTLAVVKEVDLLHMIDRLYRRTADIASFADKLKAELVEDDALETLEESIDADSAPVAKMLRSIFADAVQVNASDIHIEPAVSGIRIRQRIDGVLYENIVRNKEILSALVLKIKLMAKLNISEKRLPQDGRMHINIKNHNIDIRVSTMPVRLGESVVLRLLDQSSGMLQLEQIGMPERILKRMNFLINRPNGMIVVTGPTGSGKTTTLYAALTKLNNKSRKIITIEDPVEYTLERVNQVQVNASIDLTFANVLRAALRQDPDVVLVGEMRDEETVQIGLRAAMTGHLVLTTLHTNDAISTAARLMDMRAEPFLVANALRATLAQRLVRKNCTACVVDHVPQGQQREWLELLLGKYDPSWQFKQGTGCTLCHHTGYQGRLGVYELIEITAALANALRNNNMELFATEARKQEHYRPLALSALDYALQGLTSVAEVLRISGDGITS